MIDRKHGEGGMLVLPSQARRPRPERRLKATRVADVAGCLGYTGEAKSLAEMDEAIAGMVKERSRRGRY